jgi:phosphate:Na+ symporter
MKYSFFDFLTLLGSLGLFLYGMKIMSEGIQKAAGDKMRAILSAMTRNRVMGVLTGFIITSIIQSSSATTVMVVSFVNAGLLTLIESIGVIMGANIGTTITAWIISLLGFKVKMVALAVPLIGIGFPMLFARKDKLKSIGEFLIGFGILFIGLDFLKNAVPDLKSSPEALEFLKDLTGMGKWSTFIFIIIGTLLTIVVQSSSAAMALTLVLCNNGWIDYQSGAAIVLGENIGTTITANLASLIGNVHAKRAALSHTLFNVFGVLWMFIAFDSVTGFIDQYLVSIGHDSAFSSATSIPVALSMFHTTFNVVNTLLLIWFVRFIEKTVTRIIPSRGKADEKYQLEYIGSGLMTTPELSILEARKEIVKFGELTRRMFHMLNELMREPDKKQVTEHLARIKKYEDITDNIEIEIANFLVKVSKSELSESTSAQIRSLLRMNNNFEKIGDVCYQMSIELEKKNEEKAWFTTQQRDRLKQFVDVLNEAFDFMLDCLKGENKQGMKKAIELENKINSLRDKMRNEHFVSIEKGDYNVKSGLYYNNLYSLMEKLGDHLFNINEAIHQVNVD